MATTYTKDRRHEIPDQTPVELPIGYKAPETLEHMIQRLITNQELRRVQESAGDETFEESDDFDCDDEEPELTSSYQMNDMQEEFLNVRPQENGQPDKQPPPSDPQPETEAELPPEPEAPAPKKTKKTVAKRHKLDNEPEIE